MDPRQAALLDALIAAERDRQRRTEVVNYQPTMADMASGPANAVRGLLDMGLTADLGLNEGLDYYLGPTGIPDRLRAVMGLLDPGIYETGYSAADLIDPRTSGPDRQAAAQNVGMAAALAPMMFMRPAGALGRGGR